MTQFVENKGLV
uniref:Uncharacterized protein n=1 Tax=Anguilla anguilla TaxID=7936 RepID=A0A0E9U8Z4_ANGAN